MSEIPEMLYSIKFVNMMFKYLPSQEAKIVINWFCVASPAPDGSWSSSSYFSSPTQVMRSIIICRHPTCPCCLPSCWGVPHSSKDGVSSAAVQHLHSPAPSGLTSLQKWLSSLLHNRVCPFLFLFPPCAIWEPSFFIITFFCLYYWLTIHFVPFWFLPDKGAELVFSSLSLKDGGGSSSSFCHKFLLHFWFSAPSLLVGATQYG